MSKMLQYSVDPRANTSLIGKSSFIIRLEN